MLFNFSVAQQYMKYAVVFVNLFFCNLVHSGGVAIDHGNDFNSATIIIDNLLILIICINQNINITFNIYYISLSHVKQYLFKKNYS